MQMILLNRIAYCKTPQHMRLTSSVSCLLLGNKSSETGKSCLSTSKDTAADHINSQSSIYLLNQESPVDPPQKTQQLTTSTLDLSFTLSSIGVHPNPPEIWRTLPWRIETRNRKTTMKNTLFFFSKLLFVPIANNFSFCFNVLNPFLPYSKPRYARFKFGQLCSKFIISMHWIFCRTSLFQRLYYMTHKLN